MARARPRGVTLLGVYYAMLGVALAGLAVYGVYVRHEIPQALGAFADFPEALVALALVVALVHVLTGYGLWVLHPWARATAIGLSVIGIVVGMFTLPFGFAAVMGNVVTGWYLTGHAVRDAFVPPRARVAPPNR